jgi:hypothetical protein
LRSGRYRHVVLLGPCRVTLAGQNAVVNKGAISLMNHVKLLRLPSLPSGGPPTHVHAHS